MNGGYNPPLCPHCSGSGEGMHDGTLCIYCNGRGVEDGGISKREHEIERADLENDLRWERENGL